MEILVTWCINSQLKLSIIKINELVLKQNGFSVAVGAKSL